MDLKIRYTKRVPLSLHCPGIIDRNSRSYMFGVHQQQSLSSFRG
jgi:hypothetical protein